MLDFTFLQNPLSKKWVILAPRRAKRPDVASGMEPSCPFCTGREVQEEELYRVPATDPHSPDWLIRVLPNKFPFAPNHEVIIHSPDHHKNFDELALQQVELILQTYRLRYNTHKEKGQVYIFHNRGEAGGESLPHPHTQLAVVPFEVKTDIPRLDPNASELVSPQPISLGEPKGPSFAGPSGPDGNASGASGPSVSSGSLESGAFYLFCPKTSQWPDEVWIAPKVRGRVFGEITDEEIKDLASILQRLIRIMDLRHNNQFPFNFYIYPGGDWYLRIIPRLKSMGGFELGTGIFINTQDPQETLRFIKEHFDIPDEEKIKQQHQADYSKHA